MLKRCWGKTELVCGVSFPEEWRREEIVVEEECV